jgi:hypothetical protein
MKRMKTSTKVIKFFNQKIRRAYCKWALSKKQKSFSELTPFEKKFIMVLKRVCLLPNSDFNYGFTNYTGRLVTNRDAGVTIQIKGNQISFLDEETLTVFYSMPEITAYFTAIFDRATELRAKRQDDEIFALQMNRLTKVEQILMETPKRKPVPIITNQSKGVQRRRTQDLALDQNDILKIAFGD